MATLGVVVPFVCVCEAGSFGVLVPASPDAAWESVSRYVGGSVYLLIRRAYARSSALETGFVFVGKVEEGVAIRSRRVLARRVRVSLIWVSRVADVSRRARSFL